MKRSMFITGGVLLVFVSVWPVLGQPQNKSTSNRDRERDNVLMFQLLSPEEMANLREKWPDMSEEEKGEFRAKLREKWDKLAEEEKEKLISQSRAGFEGGRRRTLSREDQLNAVKEIEAKLTKLKLGILTEPESSGSSKEMSEGERNKLREQNVKARKEREEAIQAIIAQINVLRSQRPLRPNTSNAEFVVVSVNDLKQVQELAAKEKANETAMRVEWLIARLTSSRSISGRPTMPDSRPEGGIRPPRPGRGEP